MCEGLGGVDEESEPGVSLDEARFFEEDDILLTWWCSERNG